MSRGDTKRDFAVGPHDTLRTMPHVAPESDAHAVQPHEIPVQPGAEAAADEEHAEFFQADLEAHPADPKQHSVPPNRARHAREHGEREDGSGVYRAPRRAGLRPFALVSLSLAGIALSVLVIIAAVRQQQPFGAAAAPDATPPRTETLARITATPVETAAPSVTATPVETAAPSVTATPVETAAPSVEATPVEAPTPMSATASARARAARLASPLAPRATTTPKKTNARKSEAPTHVSRIRTTPDLESPLMP